MVGQCGKGKRKTVQSSVVHGRAEHAGHAGQEMQGRVG